MSDGTSFRRFAELFPGPIVLPPAGGSQNAWQFCFRPNGRAVDDEPIASCPSSAERPISSISVLCQVLVQPQESLSDEFDNWDQATDAMAVLEQIGMIAPAPTWARIVEILPKAGEAQEAADSHEDVIEFAKMLDAHRDVLCYGLLLALSVGQADPSQPMLSGLRAIRKWMPPPKKQPLDEYATDLKEMLQIVRGGTSLTDPGGESSTAEELTAVSAYSRKLERPSGFEVSPDEQIRCWHELFRQINRGKHNPLNTAALLKTEAALIFPTVLLQPGRSQMTIREWSQIFVHSLFGEAYIDPTCPIWAGAHALTELGLVNVAASFLAKESQRLDSEDETWRRLASSLIGISSQPPGEKIHRRIADSKSASGRKKNSFDLIIASSFDSSVGLSAKRPVTSSPVLCLDIDEADLLSGWIGKTRLNLHARRIFIEEPEEGKNPADYTSRFSSVFDKRTKVTALYRPLPSTTLFDDARATPDRLEELFPRRKQGKEI